MKKPLLIAAILLALTACAPPQLSTEETCSEADAIVTAAGSGDASDEKVKEAGQQLDALADRASDPLKDELKLMASVTQEGQEGIDEALNDPERSDEYDAAINTVTDTCGF